MPTADAFGNGALTIGGATGNSRSFNFANLAAEAISAVEVYKTSRADIATGGIGASINVRTARPLDSDGFTMSVGAKALSDSTNREGNDLTPEITGIFSFANDSKSFGVGLSATGRSVTLARHSPPSTTGTSRRGTRRTWRTTSRGLRCSSRARPIRTMTASTSSSRMRRPTANSMAYRTTSGTHSRTLRVSAPTLS